MSKNVGPYNPGDKIKLKNTYEVMETLGDGGFGTVYKGKNVKTGEIVAIKLFKPAAFTSTAECRMYWERERDITEAQGRYPGRKMDFVEGTEDKSDRANPKFFLIFSFIQGVTLKSWFNDNLRATDADRFGVDEMVSQIFVHLCDYMDFCHRQGLVHRDFTFNNIMIIKEGPKQVFPIVIDWGGGKLVDPNLVTKEPPLIEEMEGSGTCIITPGFFAPEIIQQKPPIPQTDIYMFGAVLFYALTNGYTRVKPTVSSDYILHPQDYNMNVSDTLNEIVEKATQYEPKDRFRTFGDVRVALEKHIGGQTEGLDKLPSLSNENSFVFHILNNNAIIDLKPNEIALEDNKNLRIARELIIESAAWDENYQGVFRGVTRAFADGKPRDREQFFIGYSKSQNLFYVHEGRNANPTLLNGQPLPTQWIPIKPDDEITIKSTTVRGKFELISVLDQK